MIKSLVEDAKKLLPKQQVVYVPGHLRKAFLEDPGKLIAADNGVQRGFITGGNIGGVFCRYFRAGSETELRTTANSERANYRDVFPYRHTMNFVINRLWNTYVEPVEVKE